MEPIVQKENKAQMIRDVKKEARAALHAEDHFFKTILACFMPILLFCFLAVILDALPFIFGPIPGAAYHVILITADIVIGVIFAFLIFAAIAGVFEFVSGLQSRGGRMTTFLNAADLKTILSPVSSREKTKDTLLLFSRFLLYMIPGGAVLFLFVLLGGRFLFPEGGAAFTVITVVLSVLLIFYMMAVLWHMAAIPYLEKDGMTDLRERMRASRSIMKKYRTDALRLLLTFVPLLVLSVLTLGILFFLYAMPYMAIAYGKLTEAAYLEYKENL